MGADSNDSSSNCCITVCKTRLSPRYPHPTPRDWKNFTADWRLQPLSNNEQWLRQRVISGCFLGLSLTNQIQMHSSKYGARLPIKTMERRQEEQGLLPVSLEDILLQRTEIPSPAGFSGKTEKILAWQNLITTPLYIYSPALLCISKSLHVTQI